ncbi:MAG: PEP-CTERM sorting domain-containing protein [Burkholderiaceae bacterium]
MSRVTNDTEYIVMKFTPVALFASLFLAAGTAHSAALTIKFDNPIFGHFDSTPTSDTVKVSYTYGATPTTLTRNVMAGRFSGAASHLDGIDPEIFVDSTGKVFMYCYDLFDTISGGQTVRYEVNFDGVAERTLDFLGAVNYVLNGNSNDWSDPHAWVHPVSGLQGAAIQLGIWESLYETGDAWSLDSGVLKASDLAADTKSWLDKFFAAIPEADSLGKPYAMVFEAEGAQDMITADPPGTVPVPGSLALLAAGFAGLLVRRRG